MDDITESETVSAIISKGNFPPEEGDREVSYPVAATNNHPHES